MKKPIKFRAWTATDVHKLKGLAKKNVEISKIARALNRTPDAAIEKARQLNIRLKSDHAAEQASAL